MAKNPQGKIATRKEKIGSALLIFWYFFTMFVLPEFVEGIFAVIFIYASLIAGTLIIFWPRLRRDFTEVRKNPDGYARWFFPRAGIIYLIYFLVAFVSILLSGKQSTNQEAITSLPLWIMAPMACLYAPLVEEAVFRGALRRFIRNDIIYIIISGLAFGLIHVIDESSLLEAITLSLPYCVMGAGMAYLYSQSGNLFTDMTYHFLHNFIAVMLLALII